MSRRYKLTGFARFVIFLAMMTPICYLGVMQYQNNTAVKNWVDNLKTEINASIDNDSYEEGNDTIDLEIKNEDINVEIKELKERIEALESELYNQEV